MGEGVLRIIKNKRLPPMEDEPTPAPPWGYVLLDNLVSPLAAGAFSAGIAYAAQGKDPLLSVVQLWGFIGSLSAWICKSVWWGYQLDRWTESYLFVRRANAATRLKIAENMVEAVPAVVTQSGAVFSPSNNTLYPINKSQRLEFEQSLDALRTMDRQVLRSTPDGKTYLDYTYALWRFARYGGWDEKASTAEDKWTGRGKPFTLSEFRAMRNYLISANMAWWKSVGQGGGGKVAKRQGWAVRPRVRHILEEWASYEAPPPQKEVVMEPNFAD